MRWRRLWSDIDIYFEMKEPPQRYPSIGSHTAVFDKWDNFWFNHKICGMNNLIV